MPRDISGNYTLPAGNPVVDDTIIDTAWGNGTMNDIAAQLNNVVTKDGVVGPTAPLLGPNGSLAAPTWSFTSDPDLGMYRFGANQLGFSVGNTLGAVLTSAQLLLGFLGTAALPAWSFNGDPNTGWYSPGADQIAIATNGVKRWAVDSTGQLQGTGDYSGIFPFDLNSTALTTGRVAMTFTRVGGVAKQWAIGNDTDGGTDNSWDVRDITRGVAPYSISTAGVHTFAAPSAGATMLINGIGNQEIIRYSDGTRTFAGGTDTVNGTVFIGSVSAHPLDFYAGNAQRTRLSAGGSWAMGAPTSATRTLLVTGFAGASPAIEASQGTNGFNLTLSDSGSAGALIPNASFGNLAWSTRLATGRLTTDAGGTIAAQHTFLDASIWEISAGSTNTLKAGVVIRAGGATTLPGTVSLWTSDTKRLEVTSDGRLYGTALHNNAGAVTGTTNQYVASGTYTPTLTNVTNIDASTAFVTQWVRVGNVVMVSGRVDVDPTAAAGWAMGMSLPIASNFASVQQCTGTGCNDRSAGGGNPEISIEADSVNDRANFEGGGSSTVNGVQFFQFMYLII